MTLRELHETYKGAFTKQNVAELEEMENELLHFKAFNSDTALVLGCEIVQQSGQYGEDIAVCILRKADTLPIFQYVGSTRS